MSPMNDRGTERMTTYNKICRMKSNLKYCVLIETRPGKWDAGLMGHEATQAARYIWEWLGEPAIGVESDAYLVEYIINCIDQVRTGKIK